MKQQIKYNAFRVKNGKVLPKNRWKETPHYENTPQEWPVIDRRKAGKGFRHVITVAELRQFLEILPDWGRIAHGLNGIILAPGDCEMMGWHRAGVVAICAWPRQMVQRWENEFVEDHVEILDRLGVPRKPLNDGLTLCEFDEKSARGFSLMHIFLHELGHHHDRMNTRSQFETARGEDYAEDYAIAYSNRIWEDYFRVFGW